VGLDRPHLGFRELNPSDYVDLRALRRESREICPEDKSSFHLNTFRLFRSQTGSCWSSRLTQNFLPFSLVKSGSGGRNDSSALFQVRSKRVSGVSVIPRRGQIAILSAGEGGPDSLAKNRPRSSDSADLRTIQSC